MNWIQVIIFASGVLAIWLANAQSHKWQRWASVIGIISQPFWFYDSYQHSQWGIFLLSFGFLGAWGKGFYQHWMPDIKRALNIRESE